MGETYILCSPEERSLAAVRDLTVYLDQHGCKYHYATVYEDGVENNEHLLKEVDAVVAVVGEICDRTEAYDSMRDKWRADWRLLGQVERSAAGLMTDRELHHLVVA